MADTSSSKAFSAVPAIFGSFPTPNRPCSFFLMIPRPPRPTLFPYTTLFRSLHRHSQQNHAQYQRDRHEPDDVRSHGTDRKSTRLNSSHEWISYAVFCLKKKKKNECGLSFIKIKNIRKMKPE